MLQERRCHSAADVNAYAAFDARLAGGIIRHFRFSLDHLRHDADTR